MKCLLCNKPVEKNNIVCKVCRKIFNIDENILAFLCYLKYKRGGKNLNCKKLGKDYGHYLLEIGELEKSLNFYKNSHFKKNYPLEFLWNTMKIYLKRKRYKLAHRIFIQLEKIDLYGEFHKSYYMRAIYRSFENFYSEFRKTGIFLIAKNYHFEKYRQKIQKYYTENLKEVENTTYDFNIFLLSQEEKIKNILKMIKDISITDTNVLIKGESGTGKETLGYYIHYYSNRHGKPFIVIDCTSIPLSLLESELFGYEKGAFTGATDEKTGKLELANGGTVFFNEISEIPIKLQGKLLRFFQNKEIQKIGSNFSKIIDVRIITSTSKDLYSLVKEGKFREDLFYRLNTIQIEIPPLRERKKDIKTFLDYYVAKFEKKYKKKIKINNKILNFFTNHKWRGNFLEFINTVERLVILGEENFYISEKKEEKMEESLKLEYIEKQHIKKVLEISNNKKEAARILGIDYTTLWRKIKKYNL